MKKIYLLILLSCLNIAAFATQFYPITVSSPYAGTPQVICQGSQNLATAVSYTICGTPGTGSGTLSVTPHWYLNGAIIYDGTAFITVAGGGTIALPAGSFTYNTAGTFTGNNGLKCVLTWTGASPSACGSLTTVSGSTTNVTVTAAPAVIAPSSVCTGVATTLSDALTGGTWTSGNTALAAIDTFTGVLHPVNQGTVVITYGLPSGCTRTASILIKTPPAPIAGNTQVCMGLNITLSDASLNGTWSSSVTSVATIGTISGVVSPIVTGVTVIRYSNGCGTAATQSVTVNPLPLAITGIKSACTGLTTMLSDASLGGTWSSSNPATAAINTNTGLVNGNNAGVVTITYTLPTTCIRVTSLTVTAAPPPAPIVGSNVICVGQNTTLSQVTGVGYWSVSNAGLATVDSFTGVVTGVQMGTPTISYTIGIGCTTTHSVTVKPFGPITGIDSVCRGDSVYLADIIGGGVWTSSNTNVATVNSNNGLVRSNNAGMSTIIYTSPLGCKDSVHFQVVGFPQPIAGVLHTCPGASVTLSDPTPGGVWTTDNANVATASSTSGVIHGVGADTVTINYVLRPGCGVHALLLVNPNPPAIAGPNSLCVAVQDTLTDAAANGVWTTTSGGIATIDPATGIFGAMGGGNATFVYTLPATGCKISKTILIHPLPTPTITYDHGNGTMYTETYYTAYQWYHSAQGLIPGATLYSAAALYTGNYTVKVTDTFGCVNVSAPYFFDETLLGVNYINGAGSISVYPNPATQTITINAQQTVRAVIADMDGKTLLDQADAKQINISGLADGMYFITLYNTSNQPLSTQKLIKK